jgi:2-oxoisovalerate ferredoxin oxidoreductase delta subunit
MNTQIILQNESDPNTRFKIVGLDINKINYSSKDSNRDINDYGVRLCINSELCNGCKLCLYQCAEKVLSISKSVNRKGIYPVAYTGFGCNGCGICVNVCSINGAVRIFRRVRLK